MALLSQIPEVETNGQRRDADETVRVTENLLVSQWTREDKQGRKWFNCKIQRRNPRNEAEPRSTFLPSHLLEYPAAIRALATALADCPELPDELRGRLATLAVSMQQVEADLKANGQPKEANGVDESRVLNI